MKYAACFHEQIQEHNDVENPVETQTKLKMFFEWKCEKVLHTTCTSASKVATDTCVLDVAKKKHLRKTDGVCRGCKWVDTDEIAVNQLRSEHEVIGRS